MPARSARTQGVGADLLHERCGGDDLGNRKSCKVCIRVPGEGARHPEVRTFTTTTSGLLELRDYLLAHEVTVFGMEATGS